MSLYELKIELRKQKLVPNVVTEICDLYNIESRQKGQLIHDDHGNAIISYLESESKIDNEQSLFDFRDELQIASSIGFSELKSTATFITTYLDENKVEWKKEPNARYSLTEHQLTFISKLINKTDLLKLERFEREFKLHELAKQARMGMDENESHKRDKNEAFKKLEKALPSRKINTLPIFMQSTVSPTSDDGLVDNGRIRKEKPKLRLIFDSNSLKIIHGETNIDFTSFDLFKEFCGSKFYAICTMEFRNSSPILDKWHLVCSEILDWLRCKRFELFIYIEDTKLHTLLLEKLEYIVDLKISSKYLTDGHLEYLFSRLNLESIHFTDCSLSALPERPIGVHKFYRLESLNLAGNHFQKFPASILSRYILEDLNLSSNQLQTLPSLGKLMVLKKLDLSDNRLTSLPVELLSIKSLRELNVSSNQISTFPNFVTTSNLEILDLSRNRLTSLPPCVVNFIRIKTLLISDNLLHELPPELFRLSTLEKVDFFANPELIYPPPELASFSLEDVTEFMKEKPIEITRKKIILWGDQNVGKSTLAACLTEGKLSKEEISKRIPTEGFHVIPLPPLSEDKHFFVNIWDFAGEKDAIPYHQFFLSDDSLFFLVFSFENYERKNCWDQLKRRTEYIVANSLNKAPTILLIGTHCRSFIGSDSDADFEMDWLSDRMKRTFQNSISLLKSTILELNPNFEDAEKQFNAFQNWLRLYLKQTTFKASPLYVNLIELIHSLKSDKNVRNLDFIRNQLSKSSTSSLVSEDLLRLCFRLLHNQGQLAFFEENGTNSTKILLNPRWLSLAFWDLVKIGRSETDSNDNIPLTILKSTWLNKHYDVQTVIDFLQLLDVTFRLDEVLVVPSVWPNNPTPLKAHSHDDIVSIETRKQQFFYQKMELKFQRSNVPGEVFHRVIVSMFKKFQTSYLSELISLKWNTGIEWRASKSRSFFRFRHLQNRWTFELFSDMKKEEMEDLDFIFIEFIRKSSFQFGRNMEIEASLSCLCDICRIVEENDIDFLKIEQSNSHRNLFKLNSLAFHTSDDAANNEGGWFYGETICRRGKDIPQQRRPICMTKLADLIRTLPSHWNRKNINIVQLQNLISSQLNSEQVNIICDLLKKPHLEKEKLMEELISTHYLDSIENLRNLDRLLKPMSGKFISLRKILAESISARFGDEVYLKLTARHSDRSLAGAELLATLGILERVSVDKPKLLWSWGEVLVIWIQTNTFFSYPNDFDEFSLPVKLSISLDPPHSGASKVKFDSLLLGLIESCKSWLCHNRKSIFPLPEDLQCIFPKSVMTESDDMPPLTANLQYTSSKMRIDTHPTLEFVDMVPWA